MKDCCSANYDIIKRCSGSVKAIERLWKLLCIHFGFAFAELSHWLKNLLWPIRVNMLFFTKSGANPNQLWFGYTSYLKHDTPCISSLYVLTWLDYWVLWFATWLTRCDYFLTLCVFVCLFWHSLENNYIDTLESRSLRASSKIRIPVLFKESLKITKKNDNNNNCWFPLPEQRGNGPHICQAQSAPNTDFIVLRCTKGYSKSTFSICEISLFNYWNEIQERYFNYQLMYFKSD